MELILAEEVADREVVELDTNLTNDTRLSPTEGELQLVVGLLFELEVDIDSTVFVVGLDVGVHLLRVEEAHGGDITDGALEGLLIEQVAGLRV